MDPSVLSWLKIKLLAWADIIPYYVLWMLVTYLTSVWKITFTRAADTVNLFFGAVAIMTMGLKLVVDGFMGHYWMTLISSFSYTAGSSLLAVSSPPVLSRETNSCNVTSQTQCLDQLQKLLFYLALTIVALGMAGQITSVEAFADQNSVPRWEEAKKDPESIIHLYRFLALWYFGAGIPAVLAVSVGHIKLWWVLFGIAAISILGSTIILLSGTASYKYPKSQESAITTLLRVFVASFAKRFVSHPGCDGLYERPTYAADCFYQIPQTNRLRS